MLNAAIVHLHTLHATPETFEYHIPSTFKFILFANALHSQCVIYFSYPLSHSHFSLTQLVSSNITVRSLCMINFCLLQPLRVRLSQALHWVHSSR